MTTERKYKHSVPSEEFLVECLQDNEMQRGFLNTSLESYLEDGDFSEFMRSLELVIKARQSVKSFSEDAKLNRANLYDLFKGKKNPHFRTVLKILAQLGYTLKVA